MGAFGAADVSALTPDIAIGKVDPRARGIHHHLRPHLAAFARDLVAQRHRAASRTLGLNVIQGVRPGASLLSILDQLQAQPLRIGDLGIEVGSRADYAGIQSGAKRKSGAPGAEPVPRQGRIAAGEDVIQRQPGLDEERSPVARSGGQVQQIPYPRNDPRHPVEDRNRSRQWLDVVGRVSEQTVSFAQRLAHQTKLSILQIAEAAVNHPRHGGAGSRTEIGFLHQQHVDSLKRQLVEQADPVDASADDQNGDVGVIPKHCEFGSRQLCFHRFQSHIGFWVTKTLPRRSI